MPRPTSSSRPRRPSAAAALAITAAATAATAAGSACRSDSATTAPAPPGAARLQIINAARSPVDVLVDGTVRVSALPAASVSTLLAVGEGVRRVEVRPTGGGDAGRVAAQVTARASSLALVAAQVGAGGALAAAALADTAPIPAPGTSKLRVLHLAPNAAATGIWVLAPAQAAGSGDASCYGRVVPWRYGGSTSYSQSTPGSWDVVITPDISLRGSACLPSGTPSVPPNDTTPKSPANPAPQDPHAYATARLVVPVAADQARTVVMLDAPGGGVRLESTGSP